MTEGTAPPPNQTLAKVSLLVALVGLLFGNGLVAKMRLPSVGVGAADGPAVVLALLNILLATYALYDARGTRAGSFTKAAETTEARETLRQVIHGWRYLWGTWIVMYGWLAAMWGGIIPATPWAAHVAHVLNALNGFWFYYLYFVLDMPSVPTADAPARAETFNKAVEAAALAGLAVCAVSIVSDVVSNAPPQSTEAMLAGQVIPAYAAIGMAFFFGRLDSHYLRFPRVVLAPLYLYVIIQLSWGRVESPTDTTERIVLLGLALVLKTVVFVYVSSALAAGSFTRYIVRLNKSEASTPPSSD